MYRGGGVDAEQLDGLVDRRAACGVDHGGDGVDGHQLGFFEARGQRSEAGPSRAAARVAGNLGRNMQPGVGAGS